VEFCKWLNFTRIGGGGAIRTWTTLCGSLASDVRLGGRGWGVNFLVNSRQGPESLTRGDLNPRHDLNLRWDYCAPTAGYFVQSEVGLAQGADGNTGLERLGEKLFGTGKAPPDELDGRLELLASTEGYFRFGGHPPGTRKSRKAAEKPLPLPVGHFD
jgi:hypothetical protein